MSLTLCVRCKGSERILTCHATLSVAGAVRTALAPAKKIHYDPYVGHHLW